MKEISIGISKKGRENVSAFLHKILAGENVLYAKIKNFHWNVVGSDFVQLHEFFDELADETQKTIDEVAERIRSLGGKVVANMAFYLEKSLISEFKGESLSSKQMIENLRDDYESLIRQLREGIEKCGEAGDVGTQDFLTGIMKEKEKRGWMLNSLCEVE